MGRDLLHGHRKSSFELKLFKGVNGLSAYLAALAIALIKHHIYCLKIQQQPDFTSLSRLNSSNLSVFNISTMSTGNLEGEALLHNTSRESLNIQFNTSASIPVGRNEPRDPERNSWDNNSQTTNSVQNCARGMEGLAHSNSYHVPKIMVTNVMSIVPKMSEVSEFVLRNKVSLAFITETWLQSSIAASIIDIPGYSVLRRDRSSDHHGGVCLYINAEFRYKRLDALSCCPDHEVLWV